MARDIRTATCERLFGHLKGRKVLLIGIGGGGDVIGTLPTYWDVQRVGALPQTGGLTWKRKQHDPKGAPRHIGEFQHILRVNSCIGLIGPETCVSAGTKHIEADVATALGGELLIALDVSAGAGRVRAALEEM